MSVLSSPSPYPTPFAPSVRPSCGDEAWLRPSGGVGVAWDVGRRLDGLDRVVFVEHDRPVGKHLYDQREVTRPRRVVVGASRDDVLSENERRAAGDLHLRGRAEGDPECQRRAK